MSHPSPRRTVLRTVHCSGCVVILQNQERLIGDAGYGYCLFVLAGWVFGLVADFGMLLAQLGTGSAMGDPRTIANG